MLGIELGWLCSRAAPSDCEEDTLNRDLAESPLRIVVFRELAAFKIVWPSAESRAYDCLCERLSDRDALQGLCML